MRVHPTFPVRTRFAPSPTGVIHLGSIRTALYNYLLAKNTGGSFVLRIEDTDQKRKIKGSEENIYQSLKWCGLIPDESPEIGGPYGPYKQSERKDIYKKYADILIDKGLAYYCECSKDRLNDLRQSAMKLKPPTTVTYDRKCFNKPVEKSMGGIIRFKSPETYPTITDLIHGTKNIQPQYNVDDRRYDDFVIMKSDGLPTYHFANVVDDHLMKITHVIRGEEWLSSTPKHIALYQAFGWEPPQFVHIPLLTSLNDKKLSKRDGDDGILSLKDSYLPSALINFIALFGWAPARNSGESFDETMDLKTLVERFSLDHLTRGNAKVSKDKLGYFNKRHLQTLEGPEFDQLCEDIKTKFDLRGEVGDFLKKIFPHITVLDEIANYTHLFKPIYTSEVPENCREVLVKLVANGKYDLDEMLKVSTKKEVFKSLRYALTGLPKGLKVPEIVELLGPEEVEKRIGEAVEYIDNL